MQLDTREDDIQQITNVIQKSPQISSIHIVYHGTSGCLQLGNSQLNIKNIDDYAAELETWSVSNIFLYGCRVAAGDAGAEFITKLHHLTGAEIAASTTPIGNPELGGNWELDRQTSTLCNNLAFNTEAQDSYAYILERTKQLSATANDFVALAVAESGGDFLQRFGGYDEAETARLNINITDPSSEIVYLGFSNLVDSASSNNLNDSYYFRIKDPNGNVVHGPVLVDPTGTAPGSVAPNLDGSSTGHAAAVTGPDAITGGGYDVSNSAWVFDPSSVGIAGDYYIEFDFNDSTASVGQDSGTNAAAMNIKWFDITVADNSGANPTAIDGRVWSNSWQFRTQEPGGGAFDEPFGGKLYSYNEDGLTTEIDFDGSGFRGLAFQASFNDSGPGTSGDLEEDRKSIVGEQSDPQHKVFLNQPDTNVFTPGTVGNIVGTNFNVEDLSNPQIEVEVTQDGQVELILDFDNDGNFTPGRDVRPIEQVSAGVNQLAWDGRDGAGTTIDASEFPIPVIATYGQGTTHFTAIDVEGLDNGFSVTDALGNPASLFWDYSNLSGTAPDGNPADDVLVNTDTETTTRQTWTNSDYGNTNTINTWWFANRVTTNALVVNNQPPTATNNSSSKTKDGATPANGNIITDDNGNGVDSDPDDDPLSISEIEGTAISGDNTQITGTYGTLTISPDGTYEYNVDPANTDVQSLASDGTLTETFNYTLSDSNGGEDTAELVITVNGTNADPTATNNSSSKTKDGATPANGNIITDDNGNGVDSDPDDDPLSISEIEGTAISGDNTQITGTYGTLTISPDGTYEYNVDPANTDVQSLASDGTLTETFNYTLSDSNGGEDTAELVITVNGTNNPPVADDETFTINENGQPVTIDLLDGDTDLDSDTLTVKSINGTELTPGIEQTIPVENGTVNVAEDGTVSLTPEPEYNGPIDFDYVVQDGNGGEDTGAVTGTVEAEQTNEPPTVDSGEISVIENESDTPLGLNPPVDPEGDSLTITVTEIPDLGTVTKADGTQLGIGDELTPEELENLLYDAPPEYNGEEPGNFGYTVNDGTNIVPGTVDITITPDQEPIANDDNATTLIDLPVSLKITDNDTDVDGTIEPSTVDLYPNTDGRQKTLAVPEQGNFEVDELGNVTFTPEPGFVGEATIPYTVEDNNNQIS